jgi:hypothetical protein
VEVKTYSNTNKENYAYARNFKPDGI